MRRSLAPPLFAAAGLVAAAAYLLGPRLGLAELGPWLKPVPVLFLAASTLGGGGAYGQRLALGLVLSAAGDVLLELPGRFLHGLAAFLLAHLAYVAAFLSVEARARLWRALPAGLYALAVYLYLLPGLDALAAPVALYAAAIATMLWRASACVGAGPRAAALVALAGALSFVASDTLIALDRFRGPLPGVRVPILALYWIGQLGIAASAWRRCRSARATTL